MSAPAVLLVIDAIATVAAVAIGLIVVAALLRRASVRLGSVVAALNTIADRTAASSETIERTALRFERLHDSLAEPADR